MQEYIVTTKHNGGSHTENMTNADLLDWLKWLNVHYREVIMCKEEWKVTITIKELL